MFLRTGSSDPYCNWTFWRIISPFDGQDNGGGEGPVGRWKIKISFWLSWELEGMRFNSFWLSWGVKLIRFNSFWLSWGVKLI
jgi:hypothetical protein